MSIDEAMAEDAPVVPMNRWCMLLVRQILWKTITACSPARRAYDHQLPDRFSPSQNIAASIHGHIGDMDKGFADAM